MKVWLIAAFMTLPSTPIYSMRTGSFQILNPDVAPATFDWISFSALVLGPKSKVRLILLTWARTEARRQMIRRNMANPPGGGTVADFCNEYDVRRSTFDRTVDRACKLLAAKWDEMRGLGKRS